MGEPFAHVVLHQPEIPNNTGTIGRTCVALGCRLHLIHPLGFDIDERACRRAGLDYWPRLDLREHDDWVGYCQASGGARRWLLTTKAERSLFDVATKPGDHFVFGCETRGLPDEILEANAEALVALPMQPGERSLNLSVSVGAVLYSHVRYLIEMGELTSRNARISPESANTASP
ncbi:MAG: tRNA (cytidine(34)-2'-O)-methyltransferase [Planctomycetota bacterium]